MKKLVVIDTNLLVSALWSSTGVCATVYREITKNKEATPLLNEAILNEYNTVLYRDKFHFDVEEVDNTINLLLQLSVKAIYTQESTVPLPDETDRKFYDLAKQYDALLITGNAKHYPNEPFILTPRQFLESLN